MDYLCTHVNQLLNLLTRASTLFCIPEDLISLLLRACQAVSESTSTSNSEDGDIVPVFYTGCRGRPAIAISKDPKGRKSRNFVTILMKRTRLKIEKRHVSATPVPSSLCGWNNNDVQYIAEIRITMV